MNCAKILKQILLIITFILTVNTNALASAEDTIPCDLGKKQKESIAQGASKELKLAKKSMDNYTKLLGSIKNSGGNCNEYYSSFYIDGAITDEFGWGDYDESGAKNDPNPSQNQLENLINSIEFPDTDYDISRYVELNNSRKREMKEICQAKPDDTKCAQELKTIEKCTQDLNNIISSRNTLKDHRNAAHSFLAALSDKLITNCTCSEGGSVQNCKVIDNSYEEDDVSPSGCKQINEYMAEITVCPTCKIFEKILAADQSIAEGAFNAISEPLQNLLIIGFMIFLAVQTLLLVGSPVKQTISKYLTTLTTQGFKVLVAFLLLSNSSFFYETLFTPIISSGLDFGMSLTGDNQSLIKAKGIKYTSFSATSQLLTSDFLQDIVGTADTFNEMASTTPAIGRSMICNGWYQPVLLVIPHVSLLVEGIIVYIFGMMILLSVGFYLLDVGLQLGLICSLMPFFIACWPFKQTFGYAKKGWEMTLNTFFNFVMMGVIILTANSLVQQSFQTKSDSSEDLITMLNENNIEGLKEAIDLGGLQMLILIVCCMMALKLIKDITSLANKFEGGAGISLGAKLGGTAASAVKSVGKSGMKVGSKAAGAVYEGTGAKGAVQAGKNKINNVKDKALGKMGAGKQANISGGRQNNDKNDAPSQDDKKDSNEDSGGDSNEASNSDNNGENNNS